MHDDIAVANTLAPANHFDLPSIKRMMTVVNFLLFGNVSSA
jgi:hypothetical protein